ncbi:unnamed protein product [Auanema sp. JU1783]|nr:unnamed protein product [Auanema sp. JU1783]
MNCLRIAAILLTLAFDHVSTQDHFRSILIQRACARRPSLDFCSDFKIVPPPVPSKDTKETVLVIPPQLATAPKSTEAKEKLEEKFVGTHEVAEPAVPSHAIPETVDIKHTEEPTTEIKGNLVRLPKPSSTLPKTESSNSEEIVEHSKTDVTSREGAENNNKTQSVVEDKKSVLVFVSEYCVIERERFVRNCHGETVLKTEIPFCQTYPSACSATPGVIPVISYCQRYYHKYPKYCTGANINETYLQFCYAFEQFCLPELTPAQPAESPVVSTTATPKSSLKRCEDIVDEARKVCNPFPNPRDTFNVIRCSQFLTNCKKFVDWA